MNLMKKLSLLIAAPILLVSMSGCELFDDDDNKRRSNSGTSSSSSSSSSSSGQSVQIDGVAAKGLISGGVVSIHPIIQGVLNTTPVASDNTDSDGNYSITINNYDGNPFVVRVTTDENTMMRCDLADGCGEGDNFAFGQNIPLNDSSFSLDAVVPPIPNTMSSTSVNLSVLTNTAAGVALQDLADNLQTSLESVTAAVNRANSSVANRFGVLGQLRSLPVVDLTNPASLVGVAQNVIEYNLLNVGVVEAMLSNDNTTTLANSVSTFTNQFVVNGGIADTETVSSTNVTLSEILDRASNVVNAIRTADTGSTLDLTEVSNLINANQAVAENGSTEPSAGEPEQIIDDGEELAAVKAMVATVRGIAAQSDNASAGSLEFLGNQADQLDGLFDESSAPLFEASAMTAEAIGNAFMAYYDDDTLSSYTDESTGIFVAISTLESVTTYTVDSIVAVDQTEVLVGMVGTDSNSSMTEEVGDVIQTETGTSQTTTTTGNIDFALVGTASISGGPALSLGDTTGFTMTAVEVVETEFTESAGTVMGSTASVESLSLGLRGVSLTQANGPAFSGSVSLSFTGLASSETEVMSDSGSLGDFVDGMASMGFEAAQFNIAGTATYTDGSSLKVVVALSASEYTCMGGACDGEAESPYIPMSATIVLTSTGEDSTKLIVITTVTRDTADELSISSLKFTQGSSILTVSFDPASLDSEGAQTVTITNRIGITLSLTITEDSMGEDQYSGSITYGDTTYGTIGNAAIGTGPEITYTDDSSETIL